MEKRGHETTLSAREGTGRLRVPGEPPDDSGPSHPPTSTPWEAAPQDQQKNCPAEPSQTTELRDRIEGPGFKPLSFGTDCLVATEKPKPTIRPTLVRMTTQSSAVPKNLAQQPEH